MRVLKRFGFFLVVCMVAGVISAIFDNALVRSIVFFGIVIWTMVASKPSSGVPAREESPSFAEPDFRVSIRVSPSGGGSRYRNVGDELYALPHEKGLAPARLLPDTEVAEVHGFEIRGPVYIGPLRDRYADADPAVIDPRLKVANGAFEDMGYWPAYAGLTPAQRYAYLSWLSGKRDDVDNLGFVYLYYYGFERYVLRDAVNDPLPVRNKNLRSIVSEIRRLRGLIGERRSFDGYANNLLDAIAILHRPDALDQRKSAIPSKQSFAVKMAIARYANEFPDEIVDPEWALSWLIAFGSISHGKNLREQYPVLRAFFRAAYLAKGGMKAPSCKTQLNLVFHAASRGLDDVAVLTTPKGWCDPTQLKRPLSQLQNIYDEILPGVRAFCRAREKGDRVAMLAAWPSNVSTEHQPQLHQFVQAIQRVLDSEINTVGSLIRLFWAEVPEKLTLTQARQLASAVATAGRVMVPHPQLTKVSFSSQDRVLSYPGIPLDALSPEGERVSTSIQLGAILALSDGEVHESERAILQKLVDSHSNAEERKYLSKLIEWRLICPPSMTGLKSQIDLLSEGQKREMAKNLVAIARADGVLPAEEISQLEKLFKRLGLDSGAVTKMLHVSATSGSVRSESPGEVSDKGNLRLDHAAIAAHAAATKEIHGVLEKIFSEDEPTEALSPELIASPSSEMPPDSSWHQGLLDENHAMLAEWLLTQDSWPMDKVSEKCQELGLMPNGALEKINEAAFDILGDSLLELGEVVDIYRDVLPA